MNSLKKTLYLIAISLLSSSAFAAKSYTLTVKIFSLTTHSPLQGIKVSKSIDEKKVLIGTTNKEGEVVILDVREKSLELVLEDPLNKHLSDTYFHYNRERRDETKEIYLRLSRGEEKKFFEDRDANYASESSVVVNQIASGKSGISGEDSVDFIPATPVGGSTEFSKFIARTIRYPVDCLEKGISGKVYISFIVEVDGTVTNVQVVRGVYKSLDDEAIRVIRYSPQWIPATSEGEPIRARVKTPISFMLN